jgi:glycosyltransferase involved in cell wall biosynthesis
MSSSERILLLSWTLPPETSGSATIVGNLAKQFSRKEMLVAGEQPHGRPPFVWQDDWPELVYLIKAWPEMRRGVRWWRKLQFPLLLLRCLRLARRHRYTALVVVFPNEEFLFAGYLTALWSGAKLYPYFHNTYVENRNGLGLYVARWLQARVFSKASHVFVMSKGMVELYRERYPTVQCSALVHSFNEPIPNFSPAPEPRSPLRLTICGNINESNRKAAVRVGDAIAQTEDAVLTILSGRPRSYLQQVGLLRNGTRHETISRDEVITRLKEADIVVLPHSFSGGYSLDEYRTIFPTKTIEYLICGRPILAHVPPNCYLTQFLRERRCALIVEEASIPALLAAIRRLRTDAQLRSELVRNALQAAEIFHAPRVAATLRAQLQQN